MVARAQVVLPPREFLYTLDQIAVLLNITDKYLADHYLYFDGVSTGSARGRMRARDISQDENRRDWRVGETQFVLFLRAKGFRVVEATVVR